MIRFHDQQFMPERLVDLELFPGWSALSAMLIIHIFWDRPVLDGSSPVVEEKKH